MARLTFPYVQRLYGGDPGDALESGVVSLVPPDVARNSRSPSPFGRSTAQPSLGIMSKATTAPDDRPHKPPRGAEVYDLPLDTSPVTIAAWGGVGAPPAAILATWPTVPPGMRGVVLKLGWVSDDPVLSTIWTTLVNGVPVLPYTGRVGPVGTLELPQDTMITLNSGDVFTLRAENPSLLVAIHVQARTWGWFEPGG